MLPPFLLITGFVCLIVAANLLVDGSSALAGRLNVSDLVIGLTVVAFGTSTPELFVNLIAAVKGQTGIAFGNVVGSNIANILLILGVSAAIAPLPATGGTVWKEIPFSLLAALVLGICASDHLLNGTTGILTRGEGVVFVVIYISFIGIKIASS